MTEKVQYISLKEAADYSGYSQDYLSLRARQNKLKAVKIARNWVTSKEWINDYLKKVEKAKKKKGDGREKSIKNRKDRTKKKTVGKKKKVISKKLIVVSLLIILFLLVGVIFLDYLKNSDFLANSINIVKISLNEFTNNVFLGFSVAQELFLGNSKEEELTIDSSGTFLHSARKGKDRLVETVILFVSQISDFINGSWDIIPAKEIELKN
jgi:hypothetical protein